MQFRRQDDFLNSSPTKEDILRKPAADPGWKRIETLHDLFQADTARTAAGLPENWISIACRNIRALPWYASIPVTELEQRLKSLPWWYSQLEKDKLKKPVSQAQRTARAANIQKARQAQAQYAASYVAPGAGAVAPYGQETDGIEAKQGEGRTPSELTAV
jgi:hypothetical protein